MSMRKFFFLIIVGIIVENSNAHTIITWIKDARYFDSDANGFIDSITFVYSGTITPDDFDELKKIIVLPQWRNFSIVSVLIPQTGILALKVEEKRAVPNTAVTNLDKIQIIADSLPGGGQVQKNGMTVVDRVAPVLLNAKFISYTNTADSFMVTFSENVMPVSNGQPFQFRVPGGALYTVDFVNAGTQNSYYYANPVQPDLMHNFDSVWINTNASITDLAGNVQQNPKNRRVLLDVSKYDNLITVHDAFYYDENADGFIDSITIHIKGTLVGATAQELLNMIKLPAQRNFSIVSSDLVENILILKVNEQRSEPKTSVTKDDILTVIGGIIPGKNGIKSGLVAIKDRVAVVVSRAHLITHESGNDTVYIRLSEPVQNFNSQTPFRFKKNGGTEYNVYLTLISLDANGRYIGRVNSSSATLEIGDSVWINSASAIKDIPGNAQQNPQNRKVPLTIDLTDMPIIICGASYFDDNADGFIDKIKLDYTGPLQGSDLELLIPSIILPPGRKLSIQNAAILDSSIILNVKEDRTIPQTAVSGSDKIYIQSRDLAEDGFLMTNTISVKDSMAPVLIAAQVEWYGTGQNMINVTFSETVNAVHSLIPFVFNKPDGGQYIITFKKPAKTEGNKFVGQVVSLSNGYTMKKNDSVWINSTEQVNDLNNCNQDNPKNRRIPLLINYHFAFLIAAENNPFMEGKRPLPEVVRQAYMASNVTVPEDGLIIIVEPDRKLDTEIFFEGNVSIYDVVQNPIVSKQRMVLDVQRNRLYCIWDGCNYNGRKVGAGTYTAIVKIKGNGVSLTKTIRVGVKR